MRIPPFARGMLVIAAIALAIVVLNLETSLSTAALLVRVAFFLAIALAAYMFWRDFGRREIDLWPGRSQGVFYAAVGVFVVDLGWFFVSHPSGPDLLVCFLAGAGCIYAAFKTWRDQRNYS